MKKLLYFCSLFLTLPIIIHGQNDQSSLLWEISGNDMEYTSYLFGTIHAICPDELELSETIEATIEKSSQVVLELDMDDPSFMMEMQQLSFNRDLKNISEDLSSQEIALLDDFLMKYYNTELSQVGVFKPMALMSMVILKSYDCPQTKSIEEFVLRFATKHDLEILGLESVADQMNIFDEIPQNEQIDWIIEMIKDSVGTKENASKFSQAYLKGDIDEIFSLSQETYPSMSQYEDKLLFDRNLLWVPKMKEFISTKSTFFAVGAGHLGGENGLVQLLRGEGFEVNPIELK